VGERFGACVAADGARFAVGAPGRADLGLPEGSGRVQLFELRGDGCREIARVTETPGFGAAVALAGGRLAIGHAMFSNKTISIEKISTETKQTGRVGLYRVAADGAVARDDWLTVPGASAYARVGAAVALGPDYVAAGAPGLREYGEAPGFVVVRAW
jgi:hypothetical protein